jgi:choline dehydrogenase
MASVIAAYVVIGGGSSGAVVAARLAERGEDVVLVEAGPDYGAFGDPSWPVDLVDARMLATSHDWQYSFGPWEFSRARVIGGCSSHNGAIAAVGHRRDYDDWDLPGWTSDDVAPVFASVVERMRVRAYRRDEAVPFHEECLQAAEALGWPIASDLCDLDATSSFGLETVNVSGSTRWNTAFAYLDPVRSLPNVRIVDCTLIDRLERITDGWLIHGLTVPRRPFSNGTAFDVAVSGEPVQLVAGTVIVSAGVYGTPTILQRSGIGDPTRLRAAGVQPVVESMLVGANLHDHSMVSTDRAVTPHLQAHLDEVAATGFLPEEQTLGKFVSSQATDGLYDTHVFPVVASDQTSMFHGRALVEVACMKPRSRGRVDIAGPDPRVAPDIDHRYVSDLDGHDIAVLRDGIAIAEELLSTAPVRSLVGERLSDIASDDALRSRVAHYYHPVGTCAMGTDESSVCDPTGRVRGTDHLVIADASLIPEIMRANTNLPAVMIGERIASML